MARIRSIHPGFWTEENIITVSSFARLLYIGLWQQADDGGAFEWKTLKLKVVLFPGDNLSVEELLEELVSVDLIQRYEAGGRSYGAIRNFGKWQRPKKPVRQFPMNDEMRHYTQTTGLEGFLAGSPGASSSHDGSSQSGDNEGTGSEPVPHQFSTSSPPVPNRFPTSSEPVPNRFPTGSEISQQMKDEGCRMDINKIDKSILRDAPLFAPPEILEQEIRLTSPPSSAETVTSGPVTSGNASSPRRMLTNHIHRIMVLTGRNKTSSASLLGAWMKTLGDNLDAFERILSTAEAKSREQELADPVAWMEMACMNTAPERQQPPGREPSGTEGKIVPLPVPVSHAPDARTILFSTGVETIRSMTGKSASGTRSLIGKWLKETRDDASLLNEIIREAADTRPSEPVAWVQGAIRHRMGQALPLKPLSQADQARAESFERLKKRHG